MTCHCCIRLVRRLFDDHGIITERITTGEARISFDEEAVSLSDIAGWLEEEGFEIVQDKEDQLTQQIKSAVIDLVHHTTFNAMIRNSDYLVEKFNLSYQYISTVFSRHEEMTLEKFIIQQKIEKAKELIHYGDMTLSEIAYMMGYSSVQYLSTQFKNVTGISVSEFKKDPARYRSDESSAE